MAEAKKEILLEGVEPSQISIPVERLVGDQLTKIFGDTGTYRYSGFFYEEPNAVMRDSSRVVAIEEMRRMDGAVKAVLNAIKAPILSTDWRIEGDDEEIVDFVEDQLFGMKRSWKDFLREAFAYLDFGHYVFELIWEARGDKMVVADLAPRIPHSIFRWRLSDGTPGIAQIVRTDEFPNPYAEIPADKLLILTNDKEGDDVTGQSVLRAAYKHYKLKDVFYRIQGIAAERHGVGIPVITLPDGFADQDKAKAEELVQNMRSNEKGYVTLPSEKWKLEILSPKTNNEGDLIDKAVQHHNAMIMMTVLAQFLNLGTGDTGSYSLSKDHSSFFIKHVEDKATYFCEQIREQVIRRMVVMNFGPDADIPELKFNPLGDFDMKEYSDVLKSLSDAGLIQVDGKMMQFVHETFKLPELTDEQVTTIDNDKEEVRQSSDNPLVTDPNLNKPDENKNQMPAPELKGRTGKPSGPFNPAPLQKAPSQLQEKKNCILLTDQPFSPFRPLTLLEKRSNLEMLNEQFNRIQTSFEGDMGQIQKEMVGNVTAQTKSKLDIGDIATIGVIALPFINRVRQAISRTIAESYNVGKKLAISELNKAFPAGIASGSGTLEPVSVETLPELASKLRDLQVNDITNGIVHRLERTARSTVINAANADASTPAIVSSVRDQMNDAAEKMITSVSNTVVGQEVNRGRLDVFQKYISSITQFQRSEVIDGHTCEMCLSLDGRVVKADDPIALMDIVHSGCRGMWIPVTTSDETLELDPIPQSVLDNFDTVDGRPVVNAFTNLKKAVPSSHAAKKEVTKR